MQVFDTNDEQDQAALIDALKRINATPTPEGPDLSLEDQLRLEHAKNRKEMQQRVNALLAKD